jgi:hypothetical protein
VPSIKQNSAIDRSRLQNGGRGEAREMKPAEGNRFPMPAPPPFIGNPSQFFVSSLPGIAASYDQFQRQFYGRSSLPMQRIFLPNII